MRQEIYKEMGKLKHVTAYSDSQEEYEAYCEWYDETKKEYDSIDDFALDYGDEFTLEDFEDYISYLQDRELEDERRYG